MVRILLVAPHMTNLPEVSQEIYTIERAPGLEVNRLAPDVRRRELMNELRKRQHDVLWFATHGDEDGLHLSENDILPAADLVALVRGAALFGLVLNSCTSVKLAEMVHDETGVDVVCTIADAPDISAYQLGALFAWRLGETGDFRAAFDAAKPGGTSLFRYVPEYRESLIVAPDRSIFSSEELRTIYEAINGIGQRLTTVEVELRYVRNDLNNVRIDLDSRRGDLKAPAQWAIVIAGLLMSIGLFVILWFVMGRI